MCRFFSAIDIISRLVPPNQAAQLKEVAFIPYNSHYIVAVFSPILFIVMIVMSVLMMVLKNKSAAYVFIIISLPVSSPKLCAQMDFYVPCAAEMCPNQLFLNSDCLLLL